MQKIIISVSSLKEKLLEMESDHMNLAELNFIPEQIEENTLYPAFLHFDGISKSGEYRDYESIDEFSIPESLKTHKSA